MNRGAVGAGFIDRKLKFADVFSGCGNDEAITKLVLRNNKGRSMECIVEKPENLSLGADLLSFDGKEKDVSLLFAFYGNRSAGIVTKQTDLGTICGIFFTQGQKQV